MLSNMEILNKFLRVKDLYKITLWDKLYEDYFYDLETLKAYRVLEMHGFLDLDMMKRYMVADKKKIEGYPTKALSGVYSETVTGQVGQNDWKGFFGVSGNR